MDLIEVLSKYNSQSKCIDYLEDQRWGGRPLCPYCGSDNNSSKKNEFRHKCNKCKRNFSVTIGTIFESSRLSLPKWFAAIVLIKDAKKGVSSLQLSRHLNINKNTAWYLQSRIRHAMEEQLSLSGIVQIDETFIGGSVTNMHASYVKKKKIYPGGMEHKTPVLGMIENKGKIILRVIPKANKETIRPILHDRIGPNSILITDGFGPYRTLNKEFDKHVTINHQKGQKSQGQYNLSSIEGFWALLKRAVTGVYHTISLTHLQSYMNEIAFKFNHKFDPCMFRTIVDNLLKYKKAFI